MPNPENIVKHRFKKGQTGNPNGRPKKLPELDIIIAEVLGNEDKGSSEAVKILNAMITKAKKGDVRAAEMLFDRAYGKPKQITELTGKNGKELIPSNTKILFE